MSDASLVAAAAQPAVAGEPTQLRRNSVGLAGVAGQSLSAMGLSGVIGTTIAYLVLRRRRPSVLAGIGSSVDDA